jgi:hypothetical protein
MSPAQGLGYTRFLSSLSALTQRERCDAQGSLAYIDGTPLSGTFAQAYSRLSVDERTKPTVLIHAHSARRLKTYLKLLPPELQAAIPHDGDVRQAVANAAMEDAGWSGTFLKLRISEDGEHISPAAIGDLVPSEQLGTMRAWLKKRNAGDASLTPVERALVELLGHPRTIAVLMTFQTVLDAQLRGELSHTVRLFHAAARVVLSRRLPHHGHEFHHMRRWRTERCRAVAGSGRTVHPMQGEQCHIDPLYGAWLRA